MTAVNKIFCCEMLSVSYSWYVVVFSVKAKGNRIIGCLFTNIASRISFVLFFYISKGLVSNEKCCPKFCSSGCMEQSFQIGIMSVYCNFQIAGAHSFVLLSIYLLNIWIIFLFWPSHKGGMYGLVGTSIMP